MSSGENRLFVVGKYSAKTSRFFVFRTRKAQREFIKNMEDNKRNKHTYHAVPETVTWGPEQ